MNIKQQITKLKQQMKLRELADDGYYISRQHKEDTRALFELKSLLKKHSPKP
ncbi:MAG: hypothetical protein J6J35_02470 [Alphaproteobacteria bacterium]|nr:hypothetical protein [Alphaproteobacteria bacterium]